MKPLDERLRERKLKREAEKRAERKATAEEQTGYRDPAGRASRVRTLTRRYLRRSSSS
jgi:hypothetical protein